MEPRGPGRRSLTHSRLNGYRFFAEAGFLVLAVLGAAPFLFMAARGVDLELVLPVADLFSRAIESPFLFFE